MASNAVSPVVKSLKSMIPGSQLGSPAHGSVGLFIGLRDLSKRKGGVFVRARVRHPDHEPGVDSELGATEILPISEPNLDFALPIPLHLAGPAGSVDLRLVVFEVFAVREGVLPLPGAALAPAAVAALDAEVLGEHVDRVLSSPVDAGTPADGTALLDASAVGMFAPVFERLRPRGAGALGDGGAGAPFIIITATPLSRQARALGALQLRLSFRGLPVRAATGRPSAPFLMLHRHVGGGEGALGERDFEVAWVSKPRRGGGRRDPNAPPPAGSPPFTSEAVTVTVPLVALLSRATRGAEGVAALRTSTGAAGAYVKLEVCDWDASGAPAPAPAPTSDGAPQPAADASLSLPKMGQLVVHLGELVDPSFYPASGVSAALQTEGTVSVGSANAALVIHGVQLVPLPWPEGVPANAPPGVPGGGGAPPEALQWDDDAHGGAVDAVPLTPVQPSSAPPPPPWVVPPPQPSSAAASTAAPPLLPAAPPLLPAAPPSTPAESAVARYIAGAEAATATSPPRSTRIALPRADDGASALALFGGGEPRSPDGAPRVADAPPADPSPPPSSRHAMAVSGLQAVSRAAAERGAAARLGAPVLSGGSGMGRSLLFPAPAPAPALASPAANAPSFQDAVDAAGRGAAFRLSAETAALAASASHVRAPRAAPPLPPTQLYGASIRPLVPASSTALLTQAVTAAAMAAALGIGPPAPGGGVTPPPARPSGGGAPPPPPPPPLHPSEQLEKASLLVARSATVLSRLRAAACEPPRAASAPGEWLRGHMESLESGALGAVLPPSPLRLCVAGAALALPRAAFSAVDEICIEALRRDVEAAADALQRAGGEEAAAARTAATRGRGVLSSALGFQLATAAAAASGGRLPPPDPAFGPEKTIDAVSIFQLEPLKAAAQAEVAALQGLRWPLGALEALNTHGEMKAALDAALSLLAAGEGSSSGARDTVLREYDAAHCEALHLGGRRDAALAELAALREDAAALLERVRAGKGALRAAIKEQHARVAEDARRVAALEGFAWAGDDGVRERERAAVARMRSLGSGAPPAAGCAEDLAPPLRSASTQELLALAALEAAHPASGRSRRLGLAVGRAQATATGLHAESYAALLEGARRDGEAALAGVRAAGEERLRSEAAMADGVFSAGERDGRGTAARAREAAEAAEAARGVETGGGAPIPPPLFSFASLDTAALAADRASSGELLERLVAAHVSSQWVARRLRGRLAEVADRSALLTLRYGGARDLARLRDLCRVLWAHEGAAVAPLERQRFLARALSHAPYAPALHAFLERRHRELCAQRAFGARAGARGEHSPTHAVLTPLKPFSFFAAPGLDGVTAQPAQQQTTAAKPGSALAAYLAGR